MKYWRYLIKNYNFSLTDYHHLRLSTRAEALVPLLQSNPSPLPPSVICPFHERSFVFFLSTYVFRSNLWHCFAHLKNLFTRFLRVGFVYSFIKIIVRFGLGLINRAAWFGFGCKTCVSAGPKARHFLLYLIFLFHTTVHKEGNGKRSKKATLFDFLLRACIFGE